MGGGIDDIRTGRAFRREEDGSDLLRMRMRHYIVLNSLRVCTHPKKYTGSN